MQTFLGRHPPRKSSSSAALTEGINLVAHTYGRKFLQPGDEIVLSTLEHHANIVPWQIIAKEKGAVLRVIPVSDRGEIMLEEYQRLLGPRTRLVGLTHASNSLGTILPVAEMTQMAKRYNARVLIDGAQSVAHLPVNVQQLDCDFFVFSGHKVFGPTGIGVVYAKDELLEIMPPWQGGGNMIRNVTFEETIYTEAPAKFEAGTPNVADAVGLGPPWITSTVSACPTWQSTSKSCCNMPPSSSCGSMGFALIGTARRKWECSLLFSTTTHRRGRPTARPRRHRGPRRPSLRPALASAVRAGRHCPTVVLRLQYQGRNRSTGRRRQANSANLSGIGERSLLRFSLCE